MQSNPTAFITNAGLEAIRNGDGVTAELKKACRKMRAYASRYSGKSLTNDDLEDVVGDALVASMSLILDITTSTAQVNRTLGNRIVACRRAASKRRARERSYGLDVDTEAFVESHEQELIDRDRLREVAGWVGDMICQAIRSLDVRDRDVLVHFYSLDFLIPLKDPDDLENTTAAARRTRLYRARLRFGACLEGILAGLEIGEAIPLDIRKDVLAWLRGEGCPPIEALHEYYESQESTEACR